MDKVVEQAAVGARLRDARQSVGLTQEDVAVALGIQRTSVVSIEAGKRAVTALELRRLSRLYRRSTGWILGEEPTPPIGEGTEATALFRATADLSVEDKEQVLRFAEFLAGKNSPSANARRPARRRPAGQTGIDTTPEGS
ncbi:helix-turn-helix transcriptional regulator [Arsenicicoccus bolidensis]|uniref:Helix-turn-helix domain-containing protein n=1 Tax=Arsenicicoccus bolidensis TaxID=229480 RepID=A0ABS9Q254_9MICO|nr:helix-turn-helix transcriptional regulator [Arsenicicoccus bolidensis]MCG7321350.1 helix-turn-helix domain-containing protein [Arsenicicoccus bolidensis]